MKSGRVMTVYAVYYTNPYSWADRPVLKQLFTTQQAAVEWAQQQENGGRDYNVQGLQVREK